VSGQFKAPAALSPEKEPLIPIEHFMQDDATAYAANNYMNALDEVFGEIVASLDL
jgi:hypothetical protein